SGSYSLSVSALDPNIRAQFGGRTRGNRIQYLVFAVKNVRLLRQEKPRQRVAVFVDVKRRSPVMAGPHRPHFLSAVEMVPCELFRMHLQVNWRELFPSDWNGRYEIAHSRQRQ